MDIDSRFLPELEKYVESILQQNSEYIVKELSEGIIWDDGWEICSSKMVAKAVIIATKLSAAAVLTLLVKSGNVTLNKDAFVPDLRLVTESESDPASAEPRQQLEQ